MLDLDNPVELARALMRCRSITPMDDGAMNILERALQELGFTCHRILGESPGTPDIHNLYARIGSSSPNLCFAGHTATRSTLIIRAYYFVWRPALFSAAGGKRGMLFLQELHHIMMTSGPTLVMGLLGAVYTSSSSSPSASAAGNVLLGTAVMMCVFLGKPNEIHKAWYADRHVAMLVLAAIFALSLGLNFERLDRINTENFDTMLDKYCNLPILQNAQIACDFFKQTLKEAAEKMTIQNDAYLHTKNKQSLVEKLSIATFVVLFVSLLTYVVRFDSDSFVKMDVTAWRQHIQMHRYTNWRNTLSFMGVAVWLGWVLYAQRRVRQPRPRLLPPGSARASHRAQHASAGHLPRDWRPAARGHRPQQPRPCGAAELPRAAWRG